MFFQINKMILLAGRTEATVIDFRLALREVDPSSTLKDLSTFCSNLKDSPLDIDIEIPPSQKSDLETNEGVYTNDVSREFSLEEPQESSTCALRPDWMDDELIFPPIENGRVVTGKDSDKIVLTADEQRTPVVLADIIIADDDEEVPEKEPVSVPLPTQPAKVSP